ncbi:MAG: GTP-binding protein [Siphonobacter sp.]
MDILRIATAGSVDDGKSTLIGRLLYETNSITRDKLEALEAASKRKGLDFLDLSLLTDGLIAEREQGITIDVAHIYFSTSRRKYIIADTPGHFEYTRNMVTGASNARVSLILVDARHGVVEQTFRHFFISSLLRIPKVIVCVNKMDLVGYSQERFLEIKKEFENLAAKVKFDEQSIEFVPISSLYGVNLTQKSEEVSWYEGDSLLGTLENYQPEVEQASLARFPVQYVIRPKTETFHDYRGYAGKIASGHFRVGDEVVVLPTGQQSRIATIEKFDQKVERAITRESVVITLEDDVDISRGNMLVKPNEEPNQLRELAAQVCWLDYQPLVSGKTLILQHGVNDAKTKVLSIDERIDVQSLEHLPAPGQLKLNEIGAIRLKTAKPIFADNYTENPANGAFILIDEFTNSTVGVGFIN